MLLSGKLGSMQPTLSGSDDFRVSVVPTSYGAVRSRQGTGAMLAEEWGHFIGQNWPPRRVHFSAHPAGEPVCTAATTGARSCETSLSVHRGPLPLNDPLRRIAGRDPPRGLSSTTGWRRLGAVALRLSGVIDVPVEERLEKAAGSCGPPATHPGAARRPPATAPAEQPTAPAPAPG